MSPRTIRNAAIGTEDSTMNVEYRHGIKGVGAANIIWGGRWPMRNGKFPSGHPCSGTGIGHAGLQFGSSPQLEAFRAKGYWASCFPEGDGITVDRGEKSVEQVVRDIEDCFGWKVVTIR